MRGYTINLFHVVRCISFSSQFYINIWWLQGCYGHLVKQTEILHQFFLMFFALASTISLAFGLSFLVHNHGGVSVKDAEYATPKFHRMRCGIFDTYVNQR